MLKSKGWTYSKCCKCWTHPQHELVVDTKNIMTLYRFVNKYKQSFYTRLLKEKNLFVPYKKHQKMKRWYEV